MSYNHKLPKKLSFKPQKHHGFHFILWLLGLLLPPLAVVVRFGIGTDFFLNIFLCICGYIPGHFHNFYIQNIRNNTNRARTPKWAIKAGLIDTTDRDRRTKKNQWSKRFDERNNQSSHVGQALEDGEEGDDYTPISDAERERAARRPNEGLWDDQDDVQYYNEDQAPNQKHWHYPANFEGAAVEGGSKKFGRKAKGDRWERRARTDSTSSGSTYPPAASVDDDVPEWGRDYGAKRRSSKSKKQNGRATGSLIDDLEEPSSRRPVDNGRPYDNGRPSQAPQKKQSTGRDDFLDHEF